jgi:hypothetical protein
MIEMIRQGIIDFGNPGDEDHAFRQAGALAGILPAEGIDEMVGIS